jgi:hypothetical protein
MKLATAIVALTLVSYPAHANECKGLAASTCYYLHKFERLYPHYNINAGFRPVHHRPDFRHLPDDIFDQQ